MTTKHIQQRVPKFKAIIKHSGKVILVTSLVSSISIAIDDMNERLGDIKYADNGEKVITDTYTIDHATYLRSLWAKEEPGALAMRVMHVHNESARGKKKQHLVIGKVVMEI